VEFSFNASLITESTTNLMSFSKAKLYKSKEKSIARIANALSHPARIKILHQLMYGELSYKDLVDLHPLNKATISGHLRILRLAGLIEYSICGRIYLYNNRSEDHPKWVQLILKEMGTEYYPNQAA